MKIRSSKHCVTIEMTCSLSDAERVHYVRRSWPERIFGAEEIGKVLGLSTEAVQGYLET